MNNEFMINLESFQGPLDLLLFLIKKNEVDIYNIPISKITEEYLITINLMKEMNLEIAGEFLIMASTLIYIKGKMLLPNYSETTNKDTDEEFKDPRSELVKILSEYQQIKLAAEELNKLEILGRDVFNHSNKKQKTNSDIKNLEIVNLIKAYYKLIEKYEEINSFHETSVPSKSINEKLLEIINKYPKGFKNLKLETLLTEPITKAEIIVTFLTVLELIRLNFIKLIDDNENIIIRSVKALSNINIEGEIANI